ncbi:MAG: hypothetical protein HOV86_12810 [Thermoactinospora sp.]|nr:hypothetical protein [Thermoactinospora sp.]
MNIRIMLSDTTELTTLAAWLRDDAEVRSRARVRLEGTQPRPGEMGSGFEAVSLILDHGFDLANLAIALAAWRRACRSSSDVTVERDGVTITVRNVELDDLDEIVAKLGDGA